MRSSTPIDLQGKRMLVGEHDLERLAWLHSVLEQHEIEIVDARTGSEIAHALAADGPFDAVIGDVDLPGTSGRDLPALIGELPLLLVGGATPLTIEAVLPALRRLLTLRDDDDDNWLDRYHDDGGSD